MARISGALLVCLFISAAGGTAWASTQGEIDAAAQAGQTVFLVVTEAGARGTPDALRIAREAQRAAPGTAVVTLDRGAAENADLVKRFRLLGAPLPLILVVAPNGAVAGGALLKDAKPAVLVKLIPTPRKAEMLLAFNQGLNVFIVVSRPSMPLRSSTFEAVSGAVALMEKKATVVTVEMGDKAEKAFLDELKIDPKATVPTTVVFNTKGQKTAVFKKAVTAQELVEATKKKAACCPGGSC